VLGFGGGLLEPLGGGEPAAQGLEGDIFSGTRGDAVDLVELKLEVKARSVSRTAANARA
jgi:hypothetical protein